jgi:hypothetical protein
MNKEKQLIAIAEACGMIGPFEKHEEWFENGDSDGWIIVLRDATGKRVANYLNDLNAMHGAEEELGSYIPNFLKYLNILKEVNPMCVRATAAQRAEAFLKALNLWKEEA